MIASGVASGLAAPSAPAAASGRMALCLHQTTLAAAGFRRSLEGAAKAGIRLVESNAAYDDRPGQPHDSQLYHIDYYSLPNVYVLVLLRDTTSENGPWTFLTRSVSERVKERLGYWGSRRGYRLTDEEVYSVARPADAIEFCHPRGSVLFIESSGCLHFGSRNSVKPRFQLMLGYTGACRTDFSEMLLPRWQYSVRPGDSALRRMVLQKDAPPVQVGGLVESLPN